MERLTKIRNIGISAHIDSGKTTLTERILYFTGKIKEIHEVKGKDQVGATMDWMELERERGITIQSAATYASWKDHNINIIDTPGHIDFTIEVERALRVLDGAVLVVCGVGGVQSQTITVDRQMKRYGVPRIAFINKMDRAGANAYRAVEMLNSKLKLNAAMVTIPVMTPEFRGVVDVVKMKLLTYEGHSGIDVVESDEIPQDVVEKAQEARANLIGILADIDEHICELYLEEKEPTETELYDAIRRATISNSFVPVFVGSAFKNIGVQTLLDGVLKYLPNPSERTNVALDTAKDEVRVALRADSALGFCGLGFKLEEGRYGQLTYIRVYQGKLERGSTIYNIRTGKKTKVSRLVRMHSNSMEDVSEICAGEICALFGIDCASGDTFTDGKECFYTMESMFVPEPVISLSLAPKERTNPNFSRALSRFQREDPTFRVRVDPDSKETVIYGMGELHLDIYVQRMKREYGVECVTGKPLVAYRETIGAKSEFNHTHKKQTGGAGQFARVIGYIEPISYDIEQIYSKNEFVNNVTGGKIPTQYLPACEKGFGDAVAQGAICGYPMVNVRFEVHDGLAHAVDSSELAFRVATFHAFRDAVKTANPIVLEPIMDVEVTAPVEYQGNVLGSLNKRGGLISDTENLNEEYCLVKAQVSLNAMFGYSNELRSLTQGKGEFSMDYLKHSPVPRSEQELMIKEYQKKNSSKN
ncbi:Elongation factor G, mitochondrial [Zancudomyces culisetae]|uniref:Elongation factor G, mitochondrial n=1 Tax=Zancudomyces culisetae TaxID=1213189 RepID=A0A1R1PLT0_ZANCU|nr:Elongation factor G, mitochondrial [Zancudomyces culisetae]|eukprot:OMH81889.1 Elongation factor G, mitochondrial [Zancudomyces culisetae]